ncbi:MAG: BamA/TamA family outer membrane protein [Gammaproteobacteria bacterium]
MDSAYLGVDLGLDLGAGGEWRFGLRRGVLQADPNIGSEDLPSFDIQTGAFTIGYRYDQLDSTTFPRRGSRFDLDFTSPAMPSAPTMNTASFKDSGCAPCSSGDHTLTAGLRFGSRVGGDLPVYDQFALGGFLNLSGYRTGQLRGQYAGLGGLAYYKKIAQLGGTFGGNVYAGGALELGNVWNAVADIDADHLKGSVSAFIGADTLLGPLYLGYGVASDGENSFYLMLGRP